MDERTVKAKGLRKAFFTGSNSSCRQHIRQHYELYKQKCNDEHIPINQRAIPPQVLREMKALNRETKTQSTLDGVLTKVSLPSQFTREGLLEAVAKFVACDDQVSSARRPSFSFKVLKLTLVVVGSHRQTTVQELS